VGPELDDEARGRAELPGRRVLVVPAVLPGELVRVRIEHDGVHGRSFGRVVEVLEASPERVAPACAHFGVCGGCDLLHASPSAQATLKAARVARALGQAPPAVVPSPSPLGYRAWAKLIVAPDGTLGSFAPRSHDVVDMRGCVVHAPVIERVADRLRGALGPGHDLRYVLLRATLAEARVLVTLVVRRADARWPAALLPVLAEDPAVVRVVLHVNDDPGDALLGAGPDHTLLDRALPAERLGDVEQGLGSGAFAQVNPAAAAVLYARVSAALRPAGRRIVDLYSGSGGIALTLAQAGAASVTGVEHNVEAARAASASAARMGLADRTCFLAARVEDGAATADPAADAVVLNPPRKGATVPVLEALLARAPLELVYVSCEPTTLARDLEYLAARAELVVHSTTAVDMFPQTHHVETLVHAQLGRRR
jgi:23S rRNA (uracil1939-C5)-methyltransferase